MSKRVKAVEVIEAKENISLTGQIQNPIKKVCAYCRVSTDHVEQKTSYEAQVDEYTKRIKANDKWEFAGIYADEAKTGTCYAKRNEFNRMILDCKNGKIDLILTKSISRFARNVEDSIRTVRILRTQYNVEVFFEKENISTFDPKSDMIFTILASVAQEESRNISENCTWNIYKRMKDGVPIINHNRFLGYDKDENGELVINEQEAKTVRYIFNRYLEGVGYTTIARELEAKGFLTGAGNTKWHGSTVSGILQNEKYYGDLLQQKTFTVDYLSHKRIDNKGQKEKFLIKENHQPIISKELWLAVQKKREDKFAQTSGNDTNRERFASKYAFSGRLVCGNCGNTLKRRTWNAKTDAERIVWQCNDYINKGKRSCDSKAVGDLTIKRAFVEVYNSILNDKSEFFDTFIKTIERIIKKGHDKTKYEKALKEIRQVDDKISKLVQMKIDGELSADDFKREYDNLNTYKEKFVDVRNQFVENEINGSEKLRKISVIKEVIHTNSNPLTEFDDKIFKSIVDKVIIHNPISFTFVLVNGLEIPFDAKDLRDGRKYNHRDY